MSEPKWTAEPIEVARRTDVTGYPMYAVLGEPRGNLRREQETRARLEACYNACASIPNPEAVPEMVAAFCELVRVVEGDFWVDGFDDSDAVAAGPGGPCLIEFGHIRRARSALIAAGLAEDGS